MASDAIDPVVAGMAVVSQCEGVSEIAAGRVYGAELPEADMSLMPRAAIVVCAVGMGMSPPGAGDYTAVRVSRIDVRCYGAMPADAGSLASTVDRALHQWRPRKVQGCKVWWMRRVAGPLQYRAAPGDWPVVVYTYDMMHATTQ